MTSVRSWFPLSHCNFRRCPSFWVEECGHRSNPTRWVWHELASWQHWSIRLLFSFVGNLHGFEQRQNRHDDWAAFFAWLMICLGPSQSRAGRLKWNHGWLGSSCLLANDVLASISHFTENTCTRTASTVWRPCLIHCCNPSFLSKGTGFVLNGEAICRAGVHHVASGSPQASYSVCYKRE